MTDVSVQEIIATFKGVKRENLLSTSQTDDFLDLIKKKSHWTLEEYKEFSLAYSLENMHMKIMDSLPIFQIKKKYNFKLDWNDYFNVIDNIKSTRKQKKYINYYFWYHHADMNDDVYQKLIDKPYFKLLGSNSKTILLTHAIQITNQDYWFHKYFTDDEIAKGLKKHLFSMSVYDSSDPKGQEKEQQIKEFYNRYEKFMDNKTKLRFFNQAIETGSLSLIEFLYKEKGITKLNKLVLLWHVCADTASSNTLEILHCLKKLGVKFTNKDLKKSQEHYQWGYMEYQQELLYFFKELEYEKSYNELNKDLKNKKVKSVISKV